MGASHKTGTDITPRLEGDVKHLLSATAFKRRAIMPRQAGSKNSGGDCDEMPCDSDDHEFM
ncbi:hypothetical protein AA106555_2004 [Neokomagataea thailandica NBRC 106555]|uniref:Uncharacterized protein n=1 Tax=Neokomagataea thailandica NBRC 106555 TaxID=1223520 RepID=A0ABQ0QSK7_9PROT|nr:hypothetical protein AA106555_2004 [Neokomagataea thailandica NBRC 106555]